jgi:hypothetical protein
MLFEKFLGKPARDLFGDEAVIFGQSAEILLRQRVPQIYSFISTNQMDFTNIGLCNRILWREILYRIELCAYATLIRASKWAEGAIDAYQVPNLLAWSASARGLIESVSDSFYVLKYALTVLTDNYEIIRLCIKGEYTWRLASDTNVEKLEDELIHFTHGRKLGPEEEKKVKHHARSARDYITSINEPDKPDAYEAYQELCGLTHPSAYSVLWMFEYEEKTDDVYRFSINPNSKIEYGQILHLTLKYRHLFWKLLPGGMNSAVLALKMGHLLAGHSPEVDLIDLSSIPIWPDLQMAMRNSVGRVQRPRT